MAKTMQEIAELLQSMKFRRKLFGVDEADVWRQLEGLQREYQAAFDAQEAAHAALLREREEMLSQLAAQARRPEPAHAPPVQPAAPPGPPSAGSYRPAAPKPADTLSATQTIPPAARTAPGASRPQPSAAPKTADSLSATQTIPAASAARAGQTPRHITREFTPVRQTTAFTAVNRRTAARTQNGRGDADA